MGESTSEKAPAKKKRRLKKRYIVLIAFVALLIFGAFYFRLIKIPKCHPAIQEEVDWPPAEPGFYEEASHNRLRTLEQGAFSPPGMVSMCNVPGAPAAQVVAHVPNQPRFLLIEPNHEGWEYRMYHSVDVPDTGECVRVRNDNLVEGIAVEPDADNAQGVWIRPPAALDPAQAYMVTFGGSETVRGVIVTNRPAE